VTTWQEHVSHWGTCCLCELHKSRLQPVLGMGPVPAQIMAAGQYPGAEEDKLGLPMQGAGGKWVHWAWTHVAGLDWESTFFTNILACKPPDKHKQKHVDTCGPRLVELVQLVQPRLIVAMGLVASRFFSSSDRTMTHLSGKRGVYNGVDVFFVTHPFEPARQSNPADREESMNRVTNDFRGLHTRCVELGLLNREVE